MNRELVQSAAFARSVKRLARNNPGAFAAIREVLAILAADLFAPQLKTHKLKGELAGLWSASAGYDLRIVFEIIDQKGKEAILLVSCGTHDQVY